MKMKKVSGGSICNQTKESPAKFQAYVDGKLVPLPGMGKPVVVHVRGKQPPFDHNLDAYWHFEQKAKHALRLASARLAAKRERKGESAMSAPEIQIQRMTRDQAILVMQALYGYLKTEIHHEYKAAEELVRRVKGNPQ